MRSSKKNLVLSHGAKKAIDKLILIDQEFPDLIQSEFMACLDPLVHSARIGKYAMNNWLDPDGKSCQRKVNLKSALGHAAEAYAGSEKDKDSGLPPEAHGACRLLMHLTRRLRGIKHSEDKDK